MKANSGKVWFDDLTLEELDGDGKVKRVIWRKNLTGTRGWYFWNKDGKGGAVPIRKRPRRRRIDRRRWHGGRREPGADVLRFRAAPGATVPAVGLDARGEGPADRDVPDPARLLPSRAPVQASDRAFVEQEIDAYVAWGKREKVPLFLGEWGAIRYSFDEDRAACAG